MFLPDFIKKPLSIKVGIDPDILIVTDLSNPCSSLERSSKLKSQERNCRVKEQFPITYFRKTEKILKSLRMYRRCWIAKAILNRKSNARRIMTLISLYYQNIN